MTAAAQPPARNPLLGNDPLPVEIVLHPSWWHAHAGITFDEDFFYHPAKRVESERRMESVLHERFGGHGLRAEGGRDLPVIGAVHNAAGYLLSEMLGCRIRYRADAAPDVLPAGCERLAVDADAVFAYRRFGGTSGCATRSRAGTATCLATQLVGRAQPRPRLARPGVVPRHGRCPGQRPRRVRANRGGHRTVRHRRGAGVTGRLASITAAKTRTGLPRATRKCRTWISSMSAGAATCGRCARRYRRRS